MKITEGSVYRRGSDGRWSADFHVDGRRHSVLAQTERKAKAARREKIARVQAGMPVSDARDRVGNYVERWITTTLAASDRRASTRALYATMLRNHVVPHMGDQSLASVRGGDVEALLLLLEPLLSPSSRRTVYAALRAVFDTAVRDRLLGSNPVVAVRRPRLEHREAAHLESEQLRTLLAAAVDDELGPLWIVLAGTGMRRGEALALRWADVDFDAATLRIRRTLGRVAGVGIVEAEPKTVQSRRTIALGREVVDALRAHRVAQAQQRLAVGVAWQDEGRVFTSEIGTALDPRNVGRRFKELATRAGCPQATPHTLRHTAATLLLSAGHDLAAVSEMLGHSSKVITLSVYSHVTASSRREIADALGAHVRGQE